MAFSMAKSGGGETIIAHGVRVEGDFLAQGDIVIEGEVRGTIVTAGNLRIGELARIDADIKAENAVIAGEIHGNLRINGTLELLPSSKFSGDLVVTTLSVGAGAQVNGTVHMGADDVSAKRPKKGAAE